MNVVPTRFIVHQYLCLKTNSAVPLLLFLAAGIYFLSDHSKIDYSMFVKAALKAT